MIRPFGWWFLFAVLAAAPAQADPWDIAINHDNTLNTDNELVHGSIQVHDLGVRPGPVADEDWYLVYLPPYTSFEVVFDSSSGDLDLWGPGLIQRLAADGTTVVQDATGVTDVLGSRRLAWANASNVTQLSFIRVQNAACGVSCTTDDQYRVVARETTVSLARFNNTGSQSTVLLVQNASDKTINATYIFFNASGSVIQLGSLTSFPQKALNVFPTSAVPSLAGQAGHVKIVHDAPYGTFNVKAVALEPATGFIFNTPGVVRPN